MLLEPNVPLQPEQRPGETVAEYGRWNNAALRRIQEMEDITIEWRPGKLAIVAVVGGIAIGNVRRGGGRRENPWLMSVEGFEWWQPPSRILTHWHYTYPRAADNLRHAKKTVEDVIKLAKALPPV